MESYEAIWEAEARWFSGRGLLGDILRFLEGRSLIVATDDHDPNKLNVALPLPEVTDEISGRRASIAAMVPVELQPIFNDRCVRIIRRRLDADDLASMEQRWIGMANTQQDRSRCNADLAVWERSHVARGELSLWQIAAEEFGLSPYSLPERAFFALA